MNRRRFFATAGSLAAPLGAPLPAAARAAPERPVGLKLGCQSGPSSDAHLRFLARHGVRNICGSLGRRPPGPYTVSELRALADRCAQQEISLDMVRLPFLRPSNVDRERRPAIVLGDSPARDRDIDEIAATLRACAEARVPAVTYNLTILGYQRSRTVVGRGGSRHSAWRLADDKARAAAPTRAGRVPAELYWERISYFLERVVPIAEECRVRIACHPHDPPTPPGHRGVDAVLGTVAGLERFVSIKPSAYHGLNFCQGTVAEMLADPAREIFAVIRRFGRRDKIFNVHFRNIRGRRDDFEERAVDEGDVDMARALATYHEVGYRGMLMPDHVPESDEDPDKRQALAFAYGYIQGLIHGLRAGGGARA